MVHDSIAARYAQALVEAAKTERQVEQVREQLTRLGIALHDHPDLLELLRNPHIEPEEKTAVLSRALGGLWLELVLAFVRMVVSLGRAEFLPQIVEAFCAAVDMEEGRLRVVVRSAHPLSASALSRLRARLKERARQSIEFETEIDPELLGGVQVRLDHHMIDGSVQRQLAELRNRLMTIPVH